MISNCSKCGKTIDDEQFISVNNEEEKVSVASFTKNLERRKWFRNAIKSNQQISSNHEICLTCFRIGVEEIEQLLKQEQFEQEGFQVTLKQLETQGDVSDKQSYLKNEEQLKQVGIKIKNAVGIFDEKRFVQQSLLRNNKDCWKSTQS